MVKGAAAPVIPERNHAAENDGLVFQPEDIDLINEDVDIKEDPQTMSLPQQRIHEIKSDRHFRDELIDKSEE